MKKKQNQSALTLEELRVYWQLLQSYSGWSGAVLRAHLLLGAPVLSVLLNLRNDELTDETIPLTGRGDLKHRFLVPLTPAIRAELAACRVPDGEFVFAHKMIHPEVLYRVRFISRAARAIVADHISEFELRRVRAGVEDLFVGYGVPHELRVQLMGAEKDRYRNIKLGEHAWLEDKAEALGLLESWLSGAEYVRKPASGTQVAALRGWSGWHRGQPGDGR